MYAAWISLFVATAGTPASPADVKTINVPAALASVTSNPELSGVAWSAALDRYLVVTDDAGLRERGTNHRPLVLALSKEGVLDKEPIVIQGIAALNDPESICAGPEGTFFLVTSHSVNRKGKTGHDRRQLLWLRLQQRSLVVKGKLDLTAIDGVRSLLELADLPGDGLLDIEAVTYHDGALFIGLKSPLSPAGEATVVRLAEPERAFRSGRISAASVTRFARIPLCVNVEGKRVCEGISDMLFLSDGSLALTANSPKGGEKDHGGALWRVGLPIAKSPPTLVRRFPGLKPEGVTFAPDGRSLTIVFDCDQETPRWAQIPLPTGPVPGPRP
jgi:hypothetical protein